MELVEYWSKTIRRHRVLYSAQYYRSLSVCVFVVQLTVVVLRCLQLSSQPHVTERVSDIELSAADCRGQLLVVND